MIQGNIQFKTIPCNKLGVEDFEKSAKLFSDNYGIYSSSAATEKRGKRIVLSANYYKKLAEKNNYYASLAFIDSRLVGQAYFLRTNTPNGIATWVIQLVVHKDYRNNKIGKKLLHSAWGFSNHYSWGLATSNPVTVKTLESVTLRKSSPEEILKHIDTIKLLCDQISFVDTAKIDVTNSHSVVDTDFFVDHADVNSLIDAYNDNWELGSLQEGYEWLAFTFSDQALKCISSEELNEKLNYSDEIVKEAYSRMKMLDQPWAKYAANEIEYILQTVGMNDTGQSICDFGCGNGRHINELYNRSYRNLKGIDFSHQQIKHGIATWSNLDGMLDVCDCRSADLRRNFDLILCLYDVIGSFPNENDNISIIKNINKHLLLNGHVAISVMNMELTDHLVKKRIDVYDNPNSLFELKASSTMQESGNVFDPQYILIDAKTSVVYRKEVFENDGAMSAEFIIRDRRYSKNEISDLLIENGFKIIDSKYVQLGNWANSLNATDKSAKEILIIAQKIKDI